LCTTSSYQHVIGFGVFLLVEKKKPQIVIRGLPATLVEEIGLKIVVSRGFLNYYLTRD
jgi:hypothetical protein